ncbi:MAG: GxxExxY protein [Chromatiaceae bacterium]
MEPSEELDRIARQTIGAAIEVHRNLGPGFLEGIYEAALAIELVQRGISFQRQVAVDVQYKGVKVGESRLDLLVENTLVVELKAVDTLLPIHVAQVISYLKVVKRPLGLLLNFKVEMMRKGIQRVILT